MTLNRNWATWVSPLTTVITGEAISKSPRFSKIPAVASVPNDPLRASKKLWGKGGFKPKLTRTVSFWNTLRQVAVYRFGWRKPLFIKVHVFGMHSMRNLVMHLLPHAQYFIRLKFSVEEWEQVVNVKRRHRRKIPVIASIRSNRTNRSTNGTENDTESRIAIRETD